MPRPSVLPTYSDVLDAAARIEGIVHRTPVFTSQAIDAIAGSELFFKCENLQRVGAFKFRGATHAVLSLPTAAARAGVCTHSSGNHAQALALAAKMRGIPAHIVMPSTAPSVKVAAVRGYGASITFCEPTLDARESTLDRVAKDTGAHAIHPYNHPDVIAGQGTAALELLDEYPNLDAMIAPVGGGGLMSGTTLVARARGISNVYGAEPTGADDAFRSLAKGEIVPSVDPNTIADGLLTSLGPLTFGILRNDLKAILCVDDDAIRAAMRLIFERMKMVIEPSAAVPLAAIVANPELFRGKRVGVIISGGNCDLDVLFAA